MGLSNRYRISKISDLKSFQISLRLENFFISVNSLEFRGWYLKPHVFRANNPNFNILWYMSEGWGFRTDIESVHSDLKFWWSLFLFFIFRYLSFHFFLWFFFSFEFVLLKALSFIRKKTKIILHGNLDL